MKKKYSLILLAFLCCVSMGFGQATLPVNRSIWDAGAPTGWTDGNGTNPAYTTTFACSGSNGGRLDVNGEYYMVFFSGTPDQLDYTLKISGTTTSSCLVEESANGSSWTTIVNHSSLPTSCTSYNYTLNSGTRYVRWTYTKIAQNLSIDDVNISAGSVGGCNISASGIANISCNDNSTINDGSDDYITFELNPTGSNLGSNYSVSVSGGSISPTSAAYGVAVSFTLQNGSAGGGNVTVTITDDTDGTCILDETINDPGSCSDTPDWCNLQFPANGSTNQCGEYLVYARVYENGVTSIGGADPNIEAWIGYNTSNINPSDPTWVWFPADYNIQVGNDDEYFLDLEDELPTTGTYFYASRFRYNSGPYVYGGYNGGFWNGTTNVNGEMTLVNEQVNFCNVDYPKSATINQGDNFNVYAQVYEPGITDAAGQGANISAWIGYNTIGINHQPSDPTGWTWVAATYDSDWGNNDQYTAEIGSGLAGGTYYFASMFQINCNEYSYGGIQSDNVGNFWDATNNNGALNVNSTTTDCGNESFNNSNATSSYSNNSFVGDNGVTWTYVASRDENGDANGSGINGNALMLRRLSDGSKITSSSVSGGIGDFSVKLYKGFTGAGNRQVELFINGVSQGVSTPFDDYNEHIFSVSGINLFGNVIVEIRNITAQQVIIDDIQWTCYACPTPIDASNFIASSGCGGINLLWDVGCAEEVMIVAKQGSAVTATPTGDGSAYTANTIFGSGTALAAGEFDVYEGTGTSTTITGLTNGNTYYFTIFSRSGTNWTAGVSYNNVTYNESALDVGTFTTYNRCGDIELTWIRPACYDEFLVVARDGSAVTATPSGDGSAYTGNTTFGSGTALVAGEFAVYKGSGNTATITGLTNGNTYHFEIFTRVGNTWSSGMTASGTSITGTGSNPTTFKPGDFVFIGFDSYINGPTDKYTILTMVDIGVDTEFIMANLVYEWNDPAGVSSGKWYNCATDFDVDPVNNALPPYAQIQYTGCSYIPKGSTICIETEGLGNITSITVNGSDAYSDFTIDSNNYTAGNISISSPDTMWLMQGTFSAVLTEADGSDTGSNPDVYRTFTGTVLGGLQTKGYFQSLSVAGNADGPRVSRIHPDIECLYLETGPTIDERFFGVYQGISGGTQYELLNEITDITNEWDIQSSSVPAEQYGDEVAFLCGSFFTITSNDLIEGQWKGRNNGDDSGTDWFDCHNWQNFTVPDATVDVTINGTSVRNCTVDPTINPTLAAKYNNVAECNNITLDSNSYVLGMPNSSSILNLYGNWISNFGQNYFNEGNGTVVFTGNSTQIVQNNATPLPPIATEEFYNVILNNDFDTGVSNNLYMHGDLTINTGKALSVRSNDYAYVNNKVTNNGAFYIEDSGSLIQLGNGTNTNVGDIIMDRTTNMQSLDYVYWSSPINQFNVNSIFSTSNHIYEWNPTISNDNGGQGDWVGAAGQNMSIGKGYILRAPSGYPSSVTPFTATFTGDALTGKPNNGNVSVSISRGSITAQIPGTSTPNGETIESFDDNWNLVGNPYPSAIDAVDFLNANNNLDGYVYLWRHLNQPSSSVDPFYDDFADGSNYYESDYLAYNSMGSTPPGFNGYIGAGQSFMVNMLESTPSNNVPGAATESVLFNNSMRDVFNDNSQFYRTAGETIEKHKIWLNLYNSNFDILNTILVGYATGATMERDRLYDATTKADNTKIYSIIGDDYFVIQGRALPFTIDDHIPLGLKVKTTGSYYIAIADVEGLFKTTDQTIYLKDNYSGIIYNLSEDPYGFNSVVGEFNDRFELVFRDEALSVNENILSSSELTIIEMPDGSVKFKVGGNYTISQVEIIDLLGRTLYQLEGKNQEEVYFLPQLNQSAYIAKVTLDNGQTLTKKAVKK